MSTSESTPRVGRWNSPDFWHCDGNTQSADGRPCYWSHATHIDHCENCGLVRPDFPLPEPPAPTPTPPADALRALADRYHTWVMDQTGGDAAREELEFAPEMHTIADAIDAQVVGKERVVGVITDAMVGAFKREWTASHDANAGTWDSRIRGLLVAALRAAPAVGGEPVCYAATRDGHPVLPNAIRAHKHEAQRHAELLGPEFYAVPLYAHPAPDADAMDAARYRFLRDNPFQLRAIDGNAVWGGNVSAEDFDAHTDIAMANPAFTPTPSEDRPDAE